MYFLASLGTEDLKPTSYWNRGAVQGGAFLSAGLGSVPFTPAAKRERSVTDIGDYVVCIIYDSI